MTVENAPDFRYLLGLPKGFDESKKYPCILFLHGAGSRGTDIEPLYNNTISRYYRDHETDFVLVEPQFDSVTWFDVFEQLVSFTDRVRLLPYVDSKCFSVTGNSLGGYATWHLAMSHPDWFCAVAPVCGGGIYALAERLTSLPIWAFHGEEDKVVLPEESRKMVDAVNAAGGSAKLTLYSGVTHNSWIPAYNDPELYAFLTKPKRTVEKTKGSLYIGSDFG